jgi:hypothetical protein
MKNSLNEVLTDENVIKLETVKPFLNNKELQDNLSAFLLNRFDENIKSFEKYLPDIFQKFVNYLPVRKFKFFCTDNGIPNLVFADNNEILYKYIDPILFCKIQVETWLKTKVNQIYFTEEEDLYGQFTLKYNNPIAKLVSALKQQTDTPSIQECQALPFTTVFGIGLGYPLAEILEKIEIDNLLIFEPNCDLFYASIYAFDWKNLLEYSFENNKSINIFTGFQINSFHQVLDDFFRVWGNFQIGCFATYIHYQSHEIKNILDLFNQKIKIINFSTGFFDDILFGLSHTCNTLLNKRKFVKNASLPQKYKNYPIFIIGSGPSLDKDLPFLRKNQDKALIVACGTAIDSLYHAGIHPDFYANTERVPEIVQALSVINDENFFDDIFIMCTNVTHPNLLSKFKQHAIFGKVDEPYYMRLCEFLNDFVRIQYAQLMSPLVGNMGVSGILHLGFENLYLFGLDNGKKQGQQKLHSQNTVLYNQIGHKETTDYNELNHLVPGNFGDMCQSGVLYDESRESISYLLRKFQDKNSEIRCYNCSDGAFIQHTLPLHSSDVADDFDAKEQLDKKDFFNYLTNVRSFYLKVNEQTVNNIFKTQTFKKICNEIKEKFSFSYSTKKECLVNIYVLQKFLVTTCENKENEFYVTLIMGNIQMTLISIINLLYLEKNEIQCLKKIKKIIEIFNDFLTEAPDIFDCIPNYIMGRHRDFFKNGKLGKDMPHCKAPLLPLEPSILKNKFDDPVKHFVKRYD